ncbi:MAG: RNA polymerase sigma factor [Syntrophothermus sp.]
MTDKNAQDFDLVKDFLAGNEGAFNQLVKKYHQKIYWHARQMTGNHLDADEILQEVLLVIYKKLNKFKFESSLYTWIYRITATRSLNLIKRRNLKRIFSLSDFDDDKIRKDDEIIKGIENKEKLEKLDKVLQKLPLKQREVFVLRNFEELSYDEISKITKKSVGGLKANYFHALSKVTELMK